MNDLSLSWGIYRTWSEYAMKNNNLKTTPSVEIFYDKTIHYRARNIILMLFENDKNDGIIQGK